MATSTPTPPAPPAKGKLYRALTPIDHDGKLYAIDKTLRLDDDAAEPLLVVKAIEPARKEEEAS